MIPARALQQAPHRIERLDERVHVGFSSAQPAAGRGRQQWAGRALQLYMRWACHRISARRVSTHCTAATATRRATATHCSGKVALISLIALISLLISLLIALLISLVRAIA